MFFSRNRKKNKHKIPIDLKNSEQKSHQNKTEVLPRPHFKRYYEAAAPNTSTRHADRPVTEREAQKQSLVCRAPNAFQ